MLYVELGGASEYSLLVALYLSNMLVYLMDGSAQSVSCHTEIKAADQIFFISTGHSILTPD